MYVRGIKITQNPPQRLTMHGPEAISVLIKPWLATYLRTYVPTYPRFIEIRDDFLISKNGRNERKKTFEWPFVCRSDTAIGCTTRRDACIAA